MSRIALRDALQALSALLAFAALLVSSGSVRAFVPPDEQPSFTVSVPMLEMNRTAALRSAPATRDEAGKVAASLPGDWEVRWNRLTNTPHRVSGRGLDLAPGGFTADSQVDRVARQFVDEHADLLGVRSADLALVAVTHAARHWSAIYEQTVGGIPIEGSRVDFLFSESGRLLSFSSDAYRKVGALGGLVLAADQALGAGGAGLPAPAAAAAPVLRILPIPAELPGHEELQVVFHLAYRMELVTSEPQGRWLTWVDAGTGALLWRYDLIRYLEITGTSSGSIEDFGYCDGAQNEPIKDLTVNVSGVASVFTNAAGQYSATVPDNSLRTVTAQLRGRRIRVQNNAGANASFSGQTTPGIPLAITWATAQPDERDVYVHATRAYDFVRVIDPTTPLGALDAQLPANVSLAQTCNAFWDGASINFFAAGGGCANTGRIGDVIYHEYGHGVTQFVYSPQSAPGDLHEGNSDVLANHMTERSLIGDGFNTTCDVGIRNCDNTKRWPDDAVGEEDHAAGSVICGFDWEARKGMEVLNPTIFESHSDSLWHYTRLLLKPMLQPDQVAGYFFLDDDDANITNGSPHYDALCPAADDHGFVPPGPAQTRPITVAHSPLHSTTNTATPYNVFAVMTSTAGQINQMACILHYQLNNGPVIHTAMLVTGNPNEFRGQIPAQPTGTKVSYNMTTRDLAANEGAFPTNRCFPGIPKGSLVFHVGSTLDELETNSGWIVGAAGDNAATGVWTRVDPVGTAAQPEDDRTPAPGTMCFVTGQGVVGGGLGDNDVDGGTTTLRTPVFNLAGNTTAQILYHRWYSNDTGATPGTDSWVVDVSNNGGTTWVNVENTNLSDASWREVRLDLNQIFGGPPNQVQVRFVASDLADGSLVEAGVDEFMIFLNTGQTAVNDQPGSVPVPTRFTLGPNVPNPFNPSTRISFELPARAEVSLLVYDTAGRLVRSLAEHTPYEAGTHEVAWDGRDDRGATLAAGVYHVRMAGAGFDETRKVVMVK